ncbi:hypothetical protein H0H93_013047 [Arthromyces matolae]|nr:hypothetical protein H0H93_013047 [Arthromyces matolae]
MHRHILQQTQRNAIVRLSWSHSRTCLPCRRFITTQTEYDSKYAEKLRQRALENGMTVDALKEKAKQEQVEEARRQRELKAAEAEKAAQEAALASASKAPQEDAQFQTFSSGVRKDNSPVKPLSSILNLQKLFATPHTSEQIDSLWRAYHLSRSGGTGRGYVCAAIPLALYQKMAGVADRYSSFVVPVRRERHPTEARVPGEADEAYEFYFLQWNFHDVPPVPSATEDLFAAKPASNAIGLNPKTSTILFTSLQEYKLRQEFATPYLILTHYTDLAHSHGIVLLRGEITPNSTNGSGNFMLTQADAQILSMALQKFYLWDKQDETNAGKELLKCFHETPNEFKWEELIKQATLTA